MITEAESYAARGWGIVPIIPGERRPYIKWSALDVDTVQDPAWISFLWGRYPKAEIGILTGARSGGLLAVDIDPKNGGERPTGLPQTCTATTPSGGEHLLYVYDGLTPTLTGWRPGVDVRGEGGLIVAPPAPGRAWVKPPAPGMIWAPHHDIVELPEDIAADMASTGSTRGKLVRGEGGSRAEATLRRMSESVLDASGIVGIRNDILNRATYIAASAVRRDDPTDGPSLEDVRDTMAYAAAEIGLEPAEIEQTIASALGAVERDST